MAKKLLLADDSITIQKVVGITFAQEDFDITYVDNGADAITKAKQLKPDIVLADIVMPQKNGYDVCEAIKKDPELKSIPVLLLAGTFETFDVNRGKLVGANDYIIKPFESQALIDKVNGLLSGGAPAPAAPKPAAAKPAPVAAPPKVAPAPPPAPAETAETTDLAFDLDGGSDESTNAIGEPGEATTADVGFSFDSSGSFDLGGDVAETKIEMASAAEIIMDQQSTQEAPASMEGGLDLPAVEVGADMDLGSADMLESPAVAANAEAPAGFDQFGLDAAYDTTGSLQDGDSAGLDLPPLPDAMDAGDVEGGMNFGGSGFEAAAAPAAAMPTISEAEVKQMVERQIKEVLEKVAWEIIPELAERLIQEEIHKLTSAVETPKS